ncbi:MAG: hypothetical protein ACTSQI_08110 [Candidatus Helarchaeota archaeon]
MEKHEWDDKRKYAVTFEQLIENHLILMKYLKENYGEAAVKQYYKERNELSFGSRIGKTVKFGAKLLKTISAKKFFNIFIDQLIKNAQYMIPLKCITGMDRESKRAVLHINNCQTKRVFRRSIRRFKLQNQIPVTAFCEFDCIPTFQTYGRVGQIQISGVFKEKGCDIIVEFSHEILSPSED